MSELDDLRQALSNMASREGRVAKNKFFNHTVASVATKEEKRLAKKMVKKVDKAGELASLEIMATIGMLLNDSDTGLTG